MNNKAPTIREGVTSNISPCGFLPFSQSLKFSPWREKIDEDWKEYCELKDVKFDNNAWHVACSTHEGVNKSILKYDKLYPAEISDEDFKTVMGDLRGFFYKLKDKCPIIPFNDVMINPDAVTGLVAQKWFDICKKDEAVMAMMPYFEYFWDHAHEENYPWLWKQAGKVELLKLQKLLNIDIRGFTIIPFDAFLSTARMYQAMNEMMCDPGFHRTSPMKHGVNMTHGGFRHLLRELEHNIKVKEVIEGDCIKWDSGMLDRLFDAVKQIRFFCWDKQGMSVCEWWRRTNYYYQEILESYIGLTTGQVIQKMFGNPSGQTSTTDDNCIGHLFVLCYIWRKTYGQSLYRDFRSKVNIAIYADDHIIVSEKSLGFGDFKRRQSGYRELGCDLSPEKDLVTDSFEGHTFLGLTARWDPILKTYVPNFSALKALNTLGKYEKTYNVSQVFDRVTTLLLLVAFDNDLFDVVYDYAHFLQDKYPFELSCKKIPTAPMCHAFWLCYEANQPEVKVQSDNAKDFIFALSLRDFCQRCGVRNPTFGGKEVTKRSIVQQGFMPNKTKGLKRALAQGKITQQEYNQKVAAKKKNPAQQNLPKKKTAKAKLKKKEKALISPTVLKVPMNPHSMFPKFKNGQGERLMNDTGNIVSRNNPVMNYIQTLADPARFIARIPDGEARPTACFRSIGSFNMPVSNDAYNQGRFSFCLQPKIGDRSGPDHYQAAVANASYFTANATQWQNGAWNNPAAYLSNTDGGDPRVDINAGFLTTQLPSFYGASWVLATATDLSRNTLVSGGPKTLDALNTPPDIEFYSPSFPGPYAPTGGFMVLPFGDWTVSITVKFQINNVASTFEAINFNGAGNNVTFLGITQPQTKTPAVATTYEAAAFAQVVSSPGKNFLAFNLDNAQNGLTIGTADPNVSQVSSSFITISPADFASSQVFSGAGVIQNIRPVAMATLVTYMGTLLNNGGEIAIGYFPCESATSNFYQTNSGGVGQLQLYENLRKCDRIYDGPISDGAYCIWAPFTSDDYTLRTVSSMNAHDYPVIICSGVFSPDTAVASPQLVMRVMTYVVYEFTTMYTMFETLPLVGSQAMLDAAFAVIKSQKFACQNKDHLAWIKNLLGAASRFYQSNKQFINPLLMAAASTIL